MAGGENSDKNPSAERTAINWTAAEEATHVQVAIAKKSRSFVTRKLFEITFTCGHSQYNCSGGRPESRSPIPIPLPNEP
ncbi:hypothetical protein M422DRAFT_25457 [Sphaerobolus stellatus SS14]|nr:hypothetical protein M422DRAFT_25457 [Sphaerobolus stellatus SS14]